MNISGLWPITWVAVATFVVGCEPEGCPKVWGDWSEERDISTLVDERETQDLYLSGPGRLQDIPEFHDCQEFVERDTHTNAPHFSNGVFAIFAVTDPVPAGTPYVAQGTPYQSASDRLMGFARPAAQIYAEASYDLLGIKPGLNCLYLLRDGDAWRAGIRQDGKNEQDCHDEIQRDVFGALFSLQVIRETVPDLGPEAYPKVARWHFYRDTLSGDFEYRMGVWCDEGWCEVSSPESDPTLSTSYAKGVTVDEGDPESVRVHRVKAWYDEQILADTSAGSLVPSNILGTIIPDPRLGRYTDESFGEVRWLPAARVALTPLGPLPGGNPYEGKLNFSLTDNGGGLNSVSLCRGDWEGWCQENEEPVPVHCRESQDTVRWWAKLVSPSGATEYRCASRCPYIWQIPGTARWNWEDDDEGLWMRCVNGCCEVTPDGDGDNGG